MHTPKEAIALRYTRIHSYVPLHGHMHMHMHTGQLCFPANRTLAAVSTVKNSGRLLVLGSCEIFDDKYLNREDNSKLLQCVMKLMTERAGGDNDDRYGTDMPSVGTVDADRPEFKVCAMFFALLCISD